MSSVHPRHSSTKGYVLDRTSKKGELRTRFGDSNSTVSPSSRPTAAPYLNLALYAMGGALGVTLLTLAAFDPRVQQFVAWLVAGG